MQSTYWLAKVRKLTPLSCIACTEVILVSADTGNTEWRTKNRPAVSYTNVGVGLGLCTGN